MQPPLGQVRRDRGVFPDVGPDLQESADANVGLGLGHGRLVSVRHRLPGHARAANHQSLHALPRQLRVAQSGNFAGEHRANSRRVARAQSFAEPW